MSTLHYQNKHYTLDENESVLDCLHRHQVDYPSACCAGVCQSCLTRQVEGTPDPSWQTGLKDTLIEQGYFLACLAKPNQDLVIAKPDTNETSSPAQIVDQTKLNHNVLRLRLTTEDLTLWKGGQYINLVTPDETIRSYSIANLPAQDGYIELHIKLIPEGAMSQWLQCRAPANTDVLLRGPMGQCFYTPGQNQDFSIVLAGTGTGLAPLLAIARDALQQHHKGAIHLIHGGCVDDDLYLNDALKTLDRQHAHFHYHSCVLTESTLHPQDNINSVLTTVLNELDKTQCRAYLCGPEETTRSLKTKAFLAGVASNHIYSDAFVYGSSPSNKF